MAVRTLFPQVMTAIALAAAGIIACAPVPVSAQSRDQDDPFSREINRENSEDREDNGEEEDSENDASDSSQNQESSVSDDTDEQAIADNRPNIETLLDVTDDVLDDRNLLGLPPVIEPYEPLGIRIGSFLLFPEFEAARSHSDNVFSSPTTKRSDWSTELVPSVELQSNWSQHSVSALVEFEKIIFDEFSSEDEKNLLASLRGRLDIGRRTRLEGETVFETQTESRGDINVPNSVTVQPTETSKSGALQLEHEFNRLTLRLRGELTEEEFEDVSLIGGGTFDNAARDNTNTEMIGRLSYELKPGVAVFVEGRGNEIELERANSNGLRLDSNGWVALGGLSLDIGGTITGEVGAGFAQQLPDHGTFQGVEGAILAANVIWTLNPLTQIRMDAAFDIETTILSNSIGSLVRTYGIEVEHAFRENMILTAGIAYETEDFASANQEEQTLDLVVEGEYLLNRMTAVVAGYEFSDFTSSDGSNDYKENLFRLGVRLRR